MDGGLKDLQRKALELIDERYSIAAAVAALDLETLNSVRPRSLRYRSRDEVLREFLGQASEVAAFATNLGLITAEQAAEADNAFWAAHPEFKEQGP